MKFFNLHESKSEIFIHSSCGGMQMKRSSRRWKKKRQMRWKWQRKKLKKEKHKRKVKRARSK